MDSIADIHIYNNLRLMTDFMNKLTRVGGLMIDEVSLGYKTI